MPMQTDFMVVLEDRPGMVARVGEAMGRAGVNVEGVCALISEGMGILHVLLPDGEVDAARAALDSDGLEIGTVRSVWVEQCPDRPGEMGRLMRRLASADVNCDLIYLTTTGRIVIGAEDLDRVSASLT